MSNDCSERICQFGLAHVDTPKGDLDSSSGVLSGPGVNVLTNSDVYPCGTTEQYPAATDSAGNVLTNYAHEYRECSNKGICDRGTGTCACFEGYDGSACQRASCPSTADGMCSGHGTCHTIKEIASMDNDNYYNLWDQHSTMGCICDGDYSGPDCSQRICKSGVDPLYFDEVSTARYSNYTYQFYTQSNAYTLVGNYSLVFTDHSNQQYQTAPIAWNASCWEVRHALETLPNNVIPSGSVRCFKSEMPNGHSNGQYGTASNGIEPIYDAREIIFSKYTIAFPQNPGYLPQMSINTHLDGNRPTLFSTEPVSTLGWHLYPNGFTGEDVDMVPDYCEGVTVTLGVGSSTHYLDGLTVQETKALKTCLGDSDGDSTDNVDVYNWDYGNVLNPHLIKLIDATQYYPNAVADIDATSCDNDCKIDAALKMYPSTQLCNTMAGNQAKFGVDGHNIGYCSNLNPAGFFAVLFYDPVHHSSHPFRLFTRAAQDYGTATQFFVFTTTGYLNLVSQHSLAFTQQYSWDTTTVLASHYSNVVHLSNSTTGKSLYPGYFGNIDCETNPIGSNGARDCLNKDDYVMFIASDETSLSSPSHLAANPVYPNMYTVKKIFRQEKTYKTDPSSPNNEGIRHQIHLDFGLNARYTWAGGNSSSTDVSAQVYKFHPPTNNADGGYRYVAQCSGRGICDTSSGLCECFHGYTSDNCGVINALAQ